MAAQGGLTVALVEKLAEFGGSSALSGGCLAFAGTDLQAAAGVTDSPDQLFADLREVGQEMNDEALVRTYCEAQLATYAWLKDAGIRFSPVIETASGQSVPRVHTVDPADMVRALKAAALIQQGGAPVGQMTCLDKNFVLAEKIFDLRPCQRNHLV